jgi:hypothetical protein
MFVITVTENFCAETEEDARLLYEHFLKHRYSRPVPPLAGMKQRSRTEPSKPDVHETDWILWRRLPKA